MAWPQLILDTNRERAERISELLHEHGALAVSLEDRADQPLYEPGPGETPLWANVRLVALFDSATDVTAIVAALVAAIGELPPYRIEELEDRDWERAWLDEFRPMRFGQRLWIVPTTFDPPDPEGVNIHLDPGLAFGSGTHPTTALCLEWLDGHLHEQTTVIDYGCGSGVLAIAALKLGAAKAWGTDIDAQALDASRDNAERNGVSTNLELALPEAFMPPPADVLVANILANPLKELAPRLAEMVKPGGNIVLSGILKDQAEEVRRAFAIYFEIGHTGTKEDWVCITGRRMG